MFSGPRTRRARVSGAFNGGPAPCPWQPRAASPRPPSALTGRAADRLYRHLDPTCALCRARGNPPSTTGQDMSPMPRPPASRLEQLLRSRQFVITSEITPPVSCDADDLLRKAEPLRGLADAVNVTDGASARAHLSAPIAAAILAREGHRADPSAHLPRPQPHRAAGRSHGRGRLRRAQPLVPDRRRSQGRRPAGDQAGVRRRFDHAHPDGARPARQGRAPVRAQGRGAARTLLSRRRRRAHRSPGRLEAGQARGQDRGRRRIRADAILHGCRDCAALCRAPERARRRRAASFC